MANYIINNITYDNKHYGLIKKNTCGTMGQQTANGYYDNQFFITNGSLATGIWNKNSTKSYYSLIRAEENDFFGIPIGPGGSTTTEGWIITDVMQPISFNYNGQYVQASDMGPLLQDVPFLPAKQNIVLCYNDIDGQWQTLCEDQNIGLKKFLPGDTVTLSAYLTSARLTSSKTTLSFSYILPFKMDESITTTTLTSCTGRARYNGSHLVGSTSAEGDFLSLSSSYTCEKVHSKCLSSTFTHNSSNSGVWSSSNINNSCIQIGANITISFS